MYSHTRFVSLTVYGLNSRSVNRRHGSSSERGRRDRREVKLDAVQRALEAAGVIFGTEYGEGPSVRLRK